MKTEQFIVKEDLSGVYYKMDSSDFRFGKDYLPISKIISKSKRRPSNFNHILATPSFF